MQARTLALSRSCHISNRRLTKKPQMKIQIFSMMFLLTLGTGAALAQTPSIAGDWSGQSTCAGNNPSCHDEYVVYHISIDFNDSTRVNISADKIVDGKLEWMGKIR